MPGWRTGSRGGGIQHLVVDTEIAWALSVAWRARDVLGLDGALIADRVTACAGGPFWARPALRLNQINWYARMYVAAAVVGGPADVLFDSLLKQLRRFVDGAERPMAGATVSNLGPSYRFHSSPRPPSATSSTSTAPSTQISSAASSWRIARRGTWGCPHWIPRRAAVVRTWVERVLCGYWTHAGYLNWDTGLGFKRWHQGKKLGLAQAALLGIAVCPELTPRGEWAEHVLDQSFGLFDRWVTQAGGALPPANAFDVPSMDANESSAVLAGARVQANAAQAALLGLADMPSSVPPPLYSFDPDVGRLAVTTPAYNTAVIPVNHDAFLRRDRAGAPVRRRPGSGERRGRATAGLVRGGRARRRGADRVCLAAGAGAVGREAAAAARGAARRDLEPAELSEPAVRGRVRDPAGPGRHRRAAGSRSAPRTRFKAAYIETEWRVSGAKGKQIEVLFPSWGKAKVTAVMSSGARKPVTNGMALSNIDHFHVESEHSGYVVMLRKGASGAKALTRRPSAQSSAPNPGPTLTLQVKATTVTARIAPAKTADEARALAARLR